MRASARAARADATYVHGGDRASRCGVRAVTGARGDVCGRRARWRWDAAIGCVLGFRLVDDVASDDDDDDDEEDDDVGATVARA